MWWHDLSELPMRTPLVLIISVNHEKENCYLPSIRLAQILRSSQQMLFWAVPLYPAFVRPA